MPPSHCLAMFLRCGCRRVKVSRRQGDLLPFEAFISYSTRDLRRATQVKRLLERPGCIAFLAEYDVAFGESLDSRIIAAIRRCDVFILLWSRHARESEWVPQEIGVAKAHNRPIIPIVLHESASPTGFLKGTKYLPLYKDPARGLSWLQQHVFLKASEKEQRAGLAWLGLGAAFLWLFSQDKRSRDA
jgi:hypothetical protein